MIAWKEARGENRHKPNKKAVAKATAFLFGRSDGIRTHDLLVPNQARYQLRYTPKQLFYYNKAG